MSARSPRQELVLKLLVLCGLFGCGGVVIADEAEAPDMDFLEYLGSWDESDKDWVLFSEQDAEETASGDEEIDPATRGEKVAELDDEN